VYTLLIGLDRILKIVALPMAAIFIDGFDAQVLLAQSMVLLCYALLSAGKDAVFIKRIFDRRSYAQRAFRYRVRTLLLFLPCIFLYLYFSSVSDWFTVGVICTIALFGGCYDIFDVKLQANDTYKNYLVLKIFGSILFLAICFYIKSLFVVFAPYIFAPLYHFFKLKNGSLDKSVCKFDLKNLHFTKYFYGSLLCLLAAKYELLLGFFEKNNQPAILDIALLNRLADFIAFIFFILTVRHVKTITNYSTNSRKLIDSIVKVAFVFALIITAILIALTKNLPSLWHQSLVGIALGICYGVGGLLSYVWAALNAPKILLTIGAINIITLLAISLPIYFEFGFSTFILFVAVTQVTLTFFPYFKNRKKWLLL
jgi:hypothetical protein